MNETSSRLRGIVPPLVTPLLDDDRLDIAGLERLIEHVLDGGVHGLFVLGTTGEGPSLSHTLRREFVERVSRQVGQRVPLLAGITDTSREEALEMAKIAADCGLDAVVAAPPYYFPIESQDLTRYFVQLADESPLPVYLYNMPACCRSTIRLETVRTCLDVPNIAGIKDSGGDVHYFRQLLPLREQRPDWSIFVGPESLTAQATLDGGDGGVNGGANVCPRLFVDLFDAADRGDLDQVQVLQMQVEQFGRIYGVGSDFIAFARSTKCALQLLGICSEQMASPFENYAEPDRARIVDLLQELGLKLKFGKPVVGDQRI